MSEENVVNAVKTVGYDNVDVEDAPFGIDLDSLLGDNMMGTSDSILDVGEDDTPIDLPHFKVSTRKFLDALKISNIISQGSGRDLVSRAVGMEVVNGKLEIYLTDFEMYASKSIDLINSDNILGDFISVNLPVISKLIRACPSVFTIYKDENGKYFIRLVGGDFELETINVNKDQLVMIKDADKFKEEGKLDTEEFCKVIKNLFVIASVAVTPPQRRIFFKDNDISATFLYCSARYKSPYMLPEFDLGIKGIKILYILSLGTESQELKVLKYKSRVIIKGENFSFSSALTDFKPSKQMIDSMKNVLSGEPLTINTKQLNTLAELATGLVYSLARMDFNYNDEGKIEFIMKTKRSDGMFNLLSSGMVNIKPFEKAVSVQSNLLKNLMGVFSQQSELDMYLNPNGVGFSCKGYEAVLYTENSNTVTP